MKRTLIALAALLAVPAVAQTYQPYNYQPPNGSNWYQPPRNYTTTDLGGGYQVTTGNDGTRLTTVDLGDGFKTTTGRDSSGREVRCTTTDLGGGYVVTNCN